MLQELTEKDFDKVHKSLSTKNLLITYNVIKDLAKEDIIKDLDNFYYDDNFYWEQTFKVARKRKETMIWGNDVYGCTYDINGSIKKYEKIVKDELKNRGYQFENDSFHNYMKAIFNKLRPEPEYYESVLKPDMERRKNEEILKLQNQEKNRKTEEEKEAEDFSQWQDDKIANEKIKNNKLCSNSFIYGIYIDGELCYIGKTIRCLKERLGEHIEWSILENGGGSQQDYLYKAMRECKIGYKFKILYESHNTLSNYDLEQIEKSLIENLQPKFNYEGVKVPYKFSKEK